MKRYWLLVLTVLFCSCSGETTTQNDPQQNDTPESSAVADVQPVTGMTVEEMESECRHEYEYIEFTFKKQMKALQEKVKSAASQEEQLQLLAEENPAPEMAEQFLFIAKKYPGTDAARDSVLYAIAIARGTQKDEAMTYLLNTFPDRIDLRKIADSFKEEVPSPQIEQYYKIMIDNAPTEEDRAFIKYTYAKYLSQIPFFQNTLKYNPATAEKLPAEQLAYINAQRTPEQHQELVKMLRSVVENHAETQYKGTRKLGEVAASELYEVENLQIGMKAPELEGEDLDGIKFRLSDYEGKVVMLDFWGHWCGPCRQMYGHERDMNRLLSDKPFVLLGVNSDRNLDRVRDVVREEDLSWRHYWIGPEGTKGPIAKRWNVEAWPTVYLIDGEGVIRYKNVLGAEIDRGIETLMSEMGYQVKLDSDSHISETVTDRP